MSAKLTEVPVFLDAAVRDAIILGRGFLEGTESTVSAVSVDSE